MRPARRRLRAALFVLVLTCAALVGTGATAQAPPGSPLAFEGPGDRTPLTRWSLREDPSDRGLSLGWQRSRCSGSTVTVPSVFSPGSYKGASGARNYEGSVLWYCTSFQAQAAGLYAVSFQSASYRAQVFIDGRRVASHVGPYLPFEGRSTLAAGPHTVLVRIDSRKPGQQTREGFHRTWFNWSGLNGEVTVRPVGASELSAPSISTTLAPGSSADVRVSVLLTNHGPSRAITAQGTLTGASQRIPLGFPAVTIGHGRSATVTTVAHVEGPALWSPASPSLYQLELSVPGESTYSARVGLRQLTWRSGHLMLNGHSLHLHGASIQTDALGHGDALTTGDDEAIVAELKAIGANSARSQHPLDPALLERLDAAGIMLWQGVGPVEGASNWFSTSPRLLASAESQARTAIEAERLHPSVFAWNLINEAAGNGVPAEVQYVHTIARWVHSTDPGRLVGVDVWGDHPPSSAGALYSQVDAVAETDYSGWYDSPLDSPAQLARQLRTRLSAMDRTFAGKVLVISEFGAESNTLNPAGSPGSYAFQSRVLAAHIAAYRADPHIAAMMVWVLRDYPLTPSFLGGSIRGKLPRVRLIEGINQKGLFTYGGRPKPAAGVVAGLFRAIPSP